MKTGLVLEGGGVRGIYTAGVLDVFLEEHITFDGVIGVSAGAIHGCSYLSKQKGRSIRYFKKYCQDPRFMSMKSWLKTGDIVGADFCYRKKPEMPLLTKLKYGRYPAFAKALLNRAEDYNRCMDEIEALVKEGTVFVIQPTVKLDIGRADTDPGKIQAAYDQGVADAKALLGELKAWLAETPRTETP